MFGSGVTGGHSRGVAVLAPAPGRGLRAPQEPIGLWRDLPNGYAPAKKGGGGVGTAAVLAAIEPCSLAMCVTPRREGGGGHRTARRSALDERLASARDAPLGGAKTGPPGAMEGAAEFRAAPRLLRVERKRRPAGGSRGGAAPCPSFDIGDGEPCRRPRACRDRSQCRAADGKAD